MTAVLDAPLFVVGPGRSGTTYLQRILLADKRFCGGQESHFFPAFAPVLEQFDRKLGSDRPHGLGCYWRRNDLLMELREFWYKTFRECVAGNSSAHILVEKTPVHDRYMGTIHRLLPAARFLHIVRDSRAVAASLMAAYRDGWGRSWAASTVRGAAAQWNLSITSAINGSNGLGREKYLRVHYEHLLQDCDATLARVYDWLGMATPDSKELQTQREAQGDFWYGGELSRSIPSEPKGFVRHKGSSGWRDDLTWGQRHMIWYLTRRNMRVMGYRRDGSIVGVTKTEHGNR